MPRRVIQFSGPNALGSPRAAFEGAAPSPLQDSAVVDLHARSSASIFTARQREIVALLARGLSGVQIAAELSVTPETVRTHLRNAMGRAGARTRAHLVADAAARGEIALEERIAPPIDAAAPAVPVPLAFSGEETPGEMIDSVLETAREMLSMDAAFVSDTRQGVQDLVAFTGDCASFGAGPGMSVPLEGSYCELLLGGQLGNVVRDSSAEPLVADLPGTTAADIGAYIGVPIVLQDGSVYGTFCCLSHEPSELLQDRDAQFMQVLSRLISDLLEREARDAERRQLAARAEKVEVLLTALAARDGYTGEHTCAVVDLARAIAEKLDIDPEETAQIEGVAQLHDIGKIGIPDEILRKPGRLTAQEWEVMRTHPVIGESIALSVPGLAHLAPAIRAEHERWDGAGYPDGLAGEAIPVASRIALVADAYHAMTSDRPYRAAMTSAVALEQLQRNAGTQFWPAAVDAAVAVLAG